jgi:hypothetical protein
MTPVHAISSLALITLVAVAGTAETDSPSLATVTREAMSPVQAASFARKDLTPLTPKPTPSSAPLVLATAGKSGFSICVMSPNFEEAARELQDCVAEATGARLPFVEGKLVLPAIVLGDCPEAKAAGLASEGLPPEGFELKTAPEAVFIVGSAWGVYDFLERTVSVRWYWPTDRAGRSIPHTNNLVMAPVWYADAPVFRKREYYPPFAPSGPIGGTNQELRALLRTLRSGNSWPITLCVHQPMDWAQNETYRSDRPGIFQLNPDGSRDYSMYCYSNPKTLETFLENIADHYAGRKHASFINGDAITVSPPDIGINCQCADCRKIFDPPAGDLASASKIMTTFVTKLAEEVKHRHPGKTVIFLAYMNYTRAPAGVKLPDNVQMQICGMPGIAQYKEPTILAAEQANIDSWVAATGHKMQDWHYSCWPADRTQAPYAYPHVLQAFYQANRDKTVGTFINGAEPDEWPRFHLSLYTWLKVLWNPDFDVDAMVDEYCRRMYGPAAATVRQIVQLQMDGWEKSRWPEGRLAPKSIYTASYPKAAVDRFQHMLAQARAEAARDPLAARRLAYFAYYFDDFFKEYAAVMENAGQHQLVIVKVAANPAMDGSLDDPVWRKAEPMPLVKHEDGREVVVRYPTEVRAVFTLDGVTFGFTLAEPSPAKLKREVKTRDHGLTYWDDCVELYLDPSGKNLGDFVQLIINANGAVQDGKNGSWSWNLEGLKVARKLASDSWTMEVFVPFKGLGDNARYGTGVTWYGQITRNRMSDSGSNPDSIRENQKLNEKFPGFNSNLNDFAPIRFRE